MSGALKLKAGDAEDLEVISARLQDAVGKLKDFVWLPKERRFAVLVNRFRWEVPKGPPTRVQAALRFDGVLKVQSQYLKRGAPDAIISLLAIRFTAAGGDDPGGVIELTLAGGGAFRLSVECIDAELADLTRPWTARAKPDHKDRD
ncbi:MAG TPA: DUF2948 family protein [Rhizomicrobium sp.]|jgi:hypothetical protein|nr:DUF2948 family protein [Rhizomicrobium sp.]